MAKPRIVDVEGILRERISRREIPPGTKLKEIPLAEEFGVNRARIRQALGFLEQRGLVDRIPNQGAVVATLNAASLMQIYDVFELLEGLCARLAVQNSSPESWEDLVDLFNHDLEHAVCNGDCERMYLAVKTYRSRTIEAANNPTLSDFLTSIWDKTEVMIRRTLILPGRAEQSFSEHRAIIAAMRAGDAEKAEQLKRESMRTARQMLEKYKDFVL
ncbi:MAG: GntR family transcriptional regulator [Herbaspirillum sp.]|jgi:DNA-binding GntR family transcriptional regulator|nr:GntR family transcriptional regulator [Herbaspirillum sp.]